MPNIKGRLSGVFIGSIWALHVGVYMGSIKGSMGGVYIHNIKERLRGVYIDSIGANRVASIYAQLGEIMVTARHTWVG